MSWKCKLGFHDYEAFGENRYDAENDILYVHYGMKCVQCGQKTAVNGVNFHDALKYIQSEMLEWVKSDSSTSTKIGEENE